MLFTSFYSSATTHFHNILTHVFFNVSINDRFHFQSGLQSRHSNTLYIKGATIRSLGAGQEEFRKKLLTTQLE